SANNMECARPTGRDVARQDETGEHCIRCGWREEARGACAIMHGDFPIYWNFGSKNEEGCRAAALEYGRHFSLPGLGRVHGGIRGGLRRAAGAVRAVRVAFG